MATEIVKSSFIITGFPEGVWVFTILVHGTFNPAVIVIIIIRGTPPKATMTGSHPSLFPENRSMRLRVLVVY